MQITRSSIDTQKGPADWFTGDVYIDAVAAPAGDLDLRRPRACTSRPARAPPGTRIRTARRSSSPRVSACASARAVRSRSIRPGDRVFFEPGENHWHGAAPNRFMVHIAMQQNDESGSPVTWGEHVTDEQYARRMNPTYDFSGQVALVTGAGAGMGLDTARAFAAPAPPSCSPTSTRDACAPRPTS